MNAQEFFRYGSVAAIAINGGLGLYTFEKGYENIANTPTQLGIILLLSVIGAAGFLYVFGHALMSGRTKWAAGIFFLGPVVQLCYWLFYIFSEGREIDQWDIEHSDPQRDDAWTKTPKQPANTTRWSTNPSRPANRPAKTSLRPPAFVDLRG